MANTISEQKFSNIEYYENGVCIIAKTGPNSTSKIYLKNEDIVALLSRYISYSSPQNNVSSESQIDDDDDIIYDAIY